jgi:hypothetical protein
VARKSSPGDVLREVPVYNHYFGLALYDLLQTFTQQIGRGATKDYQQPLEELVIIYLALIWIRQVL